MSTSLLWVCLLTFLASGSVSDDERLTMYEDFANTFRGEKALQACLSEDLKVSNCISMLNLISVKQIHFLFQFPAQF